MTCELWFTRSGEQPELVMTGDKKDCEFLACKMGKLLDGKFKVVEV